MSSRISRIKITAEAGGVGTVEIFGHIGWDWWAEDPEENTAKRIAKKLAELKDCDSVTVRINSLGGDVDTALAVHVMLQECKNVTTEAIGMVASAATVIFMAGKTRKINKSALFLVHKCSSYVRGNENELESELEAQRTINETMTTIYTDGGVSREKVEELMQANNGEGKWITANEAQRYGFATEVVSGTRRDAEARRAWSAEDLAEAGLPMTAGFMERMRQMWREWLNENNANTNNMKKDKDNNPVAEEENTPTPPAEPTEPTEETAEPTEATAAGDLTAELAAANAEREQLRTQVAEDKAENETLKARVAELEAVVQQTPTEVAAANGDDAQPEGKETFADWLKKQPYHDEVEAELKRREMFNN